MLRGSNKSVILRLLHTALVSSKLCNPPGTRDSCSLLASQACTGCWKFQGPLFSHLFIRSLHKYIPDTRMLIPFLLPLHLPMNIYSLRSLFWVRFSHLFADQMFAGRLPAPGLPEALGRSDKQAPPLPTPHTGGACRLRGGRRSGPRGVWGPWCPQEGGKGFGA